ncbi:3-hydroxybutyrate dehydrogenase [Actinoallomurus bryophytorum]|uniref:3-hydroxybutyrate dehydrogenase n=1 Tax=Actinoallomurus bryophytorum TaxID=1490222 RepID=A0A543CT90_9ACTN|nr:3-hydroxybutyrate dehydrogenase [Actinoallomurus bryophytorum]TQM00317.1 3-hydroxybutyrate dehydrogenase [Actinoallomurus bryophytorum]
MSADTARTPDLAGRTAVVTGGASGIGRACVLRLAEAGAHVIVVDIRADAAKEAAAEAGGEYLVADLSEPDVVDTLDVRADILVNNAGLQHVAPVHEFPPEDFSRIMRVMVETPFRLVRRMLPGMYARGWGRIVNVSSVHGLVASPFKVAYVTAKHAIEGMSKVVALEGAEHGVTSNCVNPSYVRTPLVENQITAQAEAHGLSEAEVVEQIMLEPAAIKRLLEPAEVADVVAYLCSEQASFITGASMPIDGGWTAR